MDEIEGEDEIVPVGLLLIVLILEEQYYPFTSTSTTSTTKKLRHWFLQIKVKGRGGSPN